MATQKWFTDRSILLIDVTRVTYTHTHRRGKMATQKHLLPLPQQAKLVPNLSEVHTRSTKILAQTDMGDERRIREASLI
jgi:hypothetical protein